VKKFWLDLLEDADWSARAFMVFAVFAAILVTVSCVAAVVAGPR
jgi:hypothetical protein